MELRQRYGDTFCLSLGPSKFIVLHRPEDIHQVLVTRAGNFMKGVGYNGLRRVMGQGLLTSDGEAWRHQRRIIQPAFQPSQVDEMATTMVECTQDRLAEWARCQQTKVDLHAEMMRLTLRIVGRTLFSTEIGELCDQDALGHAIYVALETANSKFESGISFPQFISDLWTWRFRRAMSTLDALVDAIVAERRRNPRGHTDLLALLIAGTDRPGAQHQLRDQLVTMLMAGNESTANALCWVFMLLSRHPEVERLVHAEICSVLGNRQPTRQDLTALTYTERTIRECLRLYPPGWMLERQAVRDDELDGYRIPRGAMIGISAWSVHRHPGLWEDPGHFNPDRFLPERSADRHRYAYIPFGGGPRKCVGDHFAMLEVMLIAVMILQGYRVVLDPSHEIVPFPGVALRPTDRMPAFLHPRRP